MRGTYKGVHMHAVNLLIVLAHVLRFTIASQTVMGSMRANI